MAAIASKNLYELLGNDHDEDSDKEPEPPVKVVDKPLPRTTKRNAGDDAPASKAPASDNRGNRRGGPSGNEGAFRDRNAGAQANRSKGVGEVADRGGRGGRGRGDRGPRRGGDRHYSRHVGGDSEKQADHGWGAQDGDAEFNDEQAGEAIAQAEQKDATAEAAADAEPKEEEPVDNSKSYEEYQKELEEKRQALAAETPEIRKANEGVKLDKKWANAKAIVKEEEEAFIAGAAKAKKERKEQAKKQVIEIETQYYQAPSTGRPARGRGDGPRRGGDRGGDRPPRGDGARGGRGRGDGPRGGGRGRGDGFRGPPRGGPRGGSSLNTDDTNAFPSLGA